MEIAGGSLQRMCIGDSVKYIDKVWHSKPHLTSNDLMTVVRCNSSDVDTGLNESYNQV